MWFNVDITKLTQLLTPTFLRKPVMLAWLKVLHSPLQDVVDWFNDNRKANLYNLAHNGQVCYLRKALNDRFDVQYRRIYITDGNLHQRRYIYTEGEQKPQWLGTIYLYDDSDYSDTGVDFIVMVPSELQYSDYEMRALIDFYRLASKRYKIQLY